MKTKLLSKLSGIVLVSILSLTGCTSSKEVGEEAYQIMFNGYSTDIVEEEFYKDMGIKPEITLEDDTIIFTFDAPLLYFTSVDEGLEKINIINDFANEITLKGKELLEQNNNKGHVRAIFILDDEPWIVSEDGETIK